MPRKNRGVFYTLFIYYFYNYSLIANLDYLLNMTSNVNLDNYAHMHRNPQNGGSRIGSALAYAGVVAIIVTLAFVTYGLTLSLGIGLVASTLIYCIGFSVMLLIMSRATVSNSTKWWLSALSPLPFAVILYFIVNALF